LIIKSLLNTRARLTAPSELCVLVRVLLVDDFDKFRKFTLLTLDASPDIEVVGEAATGAEAMGAAELLEPDLVLLDISLPDMNGFEVAKRIHQVSPDSRIIFVSANNSRMIALAALSDGAMGFVSKQNARDELLHAIQAVMQGKQFLSQNLTGCDHSMALRERSILSWAGAIGAQGSLGGRCTLGVLLERHLGDT
jgi:DNA-binding NarL/FixJ family response regulator